MALNVKNPEADRLARELAARTGETITEAIVVALKERLDREMAAVGRSRRLARLAAEVGEYPIRDGRPADEIIGYDDRGLPT